MEANARVNKIHLFWYQIRKGKGNFGDELGHYIVSKLSGLKVVHVLIPSKGLDYIHRMIHGLYMRKFAIAQIPTLLRQFFLTNMIASVGSILSMTKGKKVQIWGSGIIQKDAQVDVGTVFAVRGKETQKRLRELGILCPSVFGDPAILLPKIYNPVIKKSYMYGIIPHFTHYDYFIKIATKQDPNLCVINLTQGIESVIDQINRCEFTFTTSLHGLIVSHAYGIPSIWASIHGHDLYGDNIKFLDYFSSVEMDPYIPLVIPTEYINSELLLPFLTENKKQCEADALPPSWHAMLPKLQENLLKNAPFPIKREYMHTVIQTV